MLENAVLRPQQVIGLFPASRVWSLPVGRGGPSSPGDAQPVAGSTAKLPWKPGSTRSTRRKTRAGGFTPESGSRGGAVGRAGVQEHPLRLPAEEPRDSHPRRHTPGAGGGQGPAEWHQVPGHSGPRDMRPHGSCLPSSPACACH